MLLKSTSKQTEGKKSVIIVPSRVISRPDELEGGEQTEIAAQISLPEEGGWGWVVVFASFCSMFILDGVAFTFGSLITDIADDLNVTDSLVALVNSVAVALYFCAGPLVSAFINRFGFRACIMSGSVICSCSLFSSYFINNYATLILFYGVFSGFGYCLINMSSGLVIGFYFEKLRSLAIAIATAGSSFGVMLLFPLNTYLVALAGWRTTTLLHSAFFAVIFFFGMTFRPLLSLTVVKTSDDPTRTVTYLPNLSKVNVQPTPSASKIDNNIIKPTTAERLFGAASNANFPTAAAVVQEGILTPAAQAGPSTAAVSKLTLTAHHPQGISRRQLKQVQSIISRSSVQDRIKRNIDVTINTSSPPKKQSCWARICHWETHVPQSRPMYRDDAFYEGHVDKLPIYQKSVNDTSTEGKTGLEYQLAVSRAVTAEDLHEQRGIFTTAARRVLATMMDPTLLQKPSFLLLSLSGFLTYLGFLVPYVFLKDRNLSVGIPPYHCTLIMTVLGFSNAVGRLTLGALGIRLNPVNLYAFSCFVGGVSTILSDLSFNIYYQYSYCFIYGFFIASLACLRSMVIVRMYGLDKLTNATGMMLLFQGFGSLISTPIAGILKDSYGFPVAFYVAGVFMVLSGVILVPIEKICERETQKQKVLVKSVKK